MMITVFSYPPNKIEEILKFVYGEKPEYNEYNCDDPEDKRIAQMFGWNKRDILTAITVYETRQAKENKMTREEAKKKLVQQRNNDSLLITHTNEDDFLNKCEALGLIKFEEVKYDNALLDAIHEARGANFTDKGFIKDMENRGYTIVKKD